MVIGRDTSHSEARKEVWIKDRAMRRSVRGEENRARREGSFRTFRYGR